MTDIFDYLTWRGDLSFLVDPMNDVDTLILSRIAYIPFEEIVADVGGGSMCLGSAIVAFTQRPDAYQKVVMSADMSLCIELLSAPRFADLTVSCYRNIIDHARPMQFSATVFSLRDDLHFVGYRGTDNTLTGWKEDYNMSFVTPVPAQLEAASYLGEVAKNLGGELILGGHSKGGNLAIYAAAYIEREVQERISAIYCHDGPGFDGEVMKYSGYANISAKIHSFVPQSSVVGMMFEHAEDFTIVRSTARSFWQHDLYSWVVEGRKFDVLDTVTNSSRFIDKTLKDWLVEVPPEQREEVIECIFDLIRDTNAETLNELFSNKMETAKIVIRAMGEMDEDRRKNMANSIGSLIRAAKGNLFR